MLALTLALLVFSLLTGGQFSLLIGDGWIGNTDLAGAYASSLVFQADIWRFPLGANPLFGNTSLVFTDSIPIAALVAKAIAGIIHQPVSYIGIWFFLNSAATALVALYLAKELKLSIWGQLGLAILLAANVISPARMVGAQHLALAGSWLLLAAFLLVLKRSSTQIWVLLLLLAAGIHAYLLAMCLVVYLCNALSRRTWWQPLPVLAMLAGWMYLLGYFYPGITTVAVNEFKPYAADLGFFFNSFNWGVIPELFKPALPAQYDALLFLGSGGCLLVVVSGVLILTGKVSLLALTPLTPLLLPTILLLLAATGLSLHLFGHTFFDIPLAPPWDKPLRTFRAIGRFGWATTYLLIISALYLCMRVNNRSITILLWLACILQLADIANAHRHSLIRPYRHLEQQPELSGLNQFIQQHATHWNGQVYKLADPLELESLQLADALLAKHGARFSITHSARQSPLAVQQANLLAREALLKNRPGIYLVSARHASLLPSAPMHAIQHKNYSIYFMLNAI